MPKFRKKPLVVEAFHMTLKTRWDNSEWPNWLHAAWNKNKGEGGLWIDPESEGRNNLFCGTLEGIHRIDLNNTPEGYWIIQGVTGEIYPCRVDIFVATYDVVEKSDDI